MGDLPNAYVYAANNPSESIIAKRRGYGTIVSHNVPPYGRCARRRAPKRPLGGWALHALPCAPLHAWVMCSAAHPGAWNSNVPMHCRHTLCLLCCCACRQVHPNLGVRAPFNAFCGALLKRYAI